MKSPTILALLLPAVAAATIVAPAGARLQAPDSEARTIVARAVERAAWGQEQNFGARFRRSMTRRAQRFDGEGEVTKDERRGYVFEPYRGVPYAKLVTLDGEPIAGDDLKNEREQWEEFLATIDDPSEPDEETTVVFDKNLLERYRAELVGIRDLRGRPTYVLDFEPRQGKLPTPRRVDHALNKSRGQIWIDRDTYEIARVSFELTERVRFWWGILGSVSDANGQFERVPVAENTWLASEFDVYFHVRALFSTSRRRETTVWNVFEPITD